MHESKLVTLAKIAGIFIFLYLFIVGIGAMGHSFKLFGKEFSEKILTATSSPLVGLFIGVLATSLVQSSSTTTSLIVGMVAGGAISIEGAIPMVMGANIGTTITNTMVSMGHLTNRGQFKRAFAAATVHDFFNLLTLLILFPLEMMTHYLARLANMMSLAFQGMGGMKLGNPLKAATTPAINLMADLVHQRPVLLLLLGALLTFGMMTLIVKTLRTLVLEKVEALFDQILFKTASRALLFGILLTIAVQSSSITTSLIIPLVGAGLLTLRQIFPYTLGANIGTTVTSMLAALSTTNPAAITVAFAHLMFNVTGITIILPFKFMRNIPLRMSEWMAEKATENRWIPLIYIGVVFFLVPIFLILITR
ncbi:MAG: Na/Pi symporter [Candidatus Marinimicrobia bacterium]|nr:Na/Pi symporter [Candidatus Neomarinimicrobiota bacterium]